MYDNSPITLASTGGEPNGAPANDTKDAAPSIRIGFTDQRLTAHGGLVVWPHFLHQKDFRRQLRERLPHNPTSPNAHDPTDVALGSVGGILCGADKLSRVADTNAVAGLNGYWR